MPKHILIVVSCHNRPDLTGLTLDQIERQKSSISDVLAIEDGDELGKDFFGAWPSVKYLPSTARGPAKMARSRLTAFLSDSQKFLLALDSDVLLAKDFDLKALNYWLEMTRDLGRCLFSGYRSIGYKPFFASGQLVAVEHVGGLFHFLSRDDAEPALKQMDETKGWDDRQWDRNFCKCFSRIFVPRRSLAEHTGRHGSGFNGYSEDQAIDFEGYN